MTKFVKYSSITSRKVNILKSFAYMVVETIKVNLLGKDISLEEYLALIYLEDFHDNS